MSSKSYLAVNDLAALYVDRDDSTIKYTIAPSSEFSLPSTGGSNSMTTLTTNGPHALTAADSSKLIVLHKTGGIIITLPASASAAGLRYSFVLRTTPSAGSHAIKTTGDVEEIHGVVVSAELDAANPTTSSGGTAKNQISFVQSEALIGDSVEVRCDGTFWYARAYCNVGTAVRLLGS